MGIYEGFDPSQVPEPFGNRHDPKHTDTSRSGDLVGRLRSVDVSWSETGEWCAEAADRIEQLEREKAVVSDLWEQQKEIALGYLADCNALGAENERLREVLGFAMRTLEAEGFREDGPTMTRIRAALGEKQ